MGHELHDACGVVGYFDVSEQRGDISRLAYLGLFALQHRGQDSAGIAVNNNGKIFCHKEQGLVVEVFDDMTLNMLQGHAAIGHVRYPMGGDSNVVNAQPLLIKSKTGQIALAHNGMLTNCEELRDRMEEQGAIFQTTSDAEVMLSLLARNSILADRIEDAIFMMMAEVKGAYALTIMTKDKVIGVRDPDGIRPLCIGVLGDTYVLASESCALDTIGATFIRDVDPGEVVTLDANGLSAEYFQPDEMGNNSLKGKLCSFEFVYFARPDSVIDGADVHFARLAAGRQLAIEAPVEADVIVGAPDSGMMAALGYAKESGIEFNQGLLKNRYVGRTFIQPTQMKREISIAMKFAPLRYTLQGKRVCLIDDSIVRGTTMRRLVEMIKASGAAEVHLRIACSPVVYPCFYGVDTPSQGELSACNMTKAALQKLINADSLEFISLEGLKNSLKGLRCDCCTACLDGNYPAGIPEAEIMDLRKIDLIENGYTGGGK
ncbi:MAG: amidophosphoribosyltransferase [Fastidiosipilaceae bacterium]|jgi:amidophosphoribosyltransferase